MAVAGLRDMSTEEPVPPGKDNAIVTIGFRDPARVVDAVHVGRHQQGPEYICDRTNPVTQDWPPLAATGLPVNGAGVLPGETQS